ncbi:MAG: hypothetical protein HQ570_01145 [Candidatus Omnitrophica bacterium]|nr:hypothetical protein [Candidatus Omnitrophota bacterium]
MKKTNYYPGVIFIILSAFLWLSLNAIAEEVEAEDVGLTIQEPKSDVMVFENICQESFDIYSSKIEQWWILGSDDAIKAWNIEIDVCEKRKKKEIQTDCKARTNQKYYSLLKNLAEIKKLKIQKIEEAYNGCQAKEEVVGTEEDIKK